jgi:hypothetical protein
MFSTGTTTPKTPIEPGAHPKLPLVDPGTFGLFLKHGAYEYEEEPHYDEYKEYKEPPQEDYYTPPSHSGYHSKGKYGHGSKHHGPKY